MYHRKCRINIPQEITSLYTKEGESLVHFVMCRDDRHNLIMCRWTKLSTHADQALVFLTTEGDHRVLPQSVYLTTKYWPGSVLHMRFSACIYP